MFFQSWIVEQSCSKFCPLWFPGKPGLRNEDRGSRIEDRGSGIKDQGSVDQGSSEKKKKKTIKS